MRLSTRLGYRKTLLRLFCWLGSRCAVAREASFQKNQVKKILVFQLGGIGDVLLTFPLIRKLSEAFPAARLSVLTEFGSELFGLHPQAGAISAYYRYEPRGRHRSPLHKYLFFRSVGRDGHDLILNTNRGNILAETAIMAYVMGCANRVGFDSEGAGFLNTTRIEFQYDRYILEQNLDLLTRIGIATGGEQDIPIHVPQEAKMAVGRWWQAHHVGRNDRVVVVHAGAKFDRLHKMWPLESYAALINEMVLRHRVKVILIGDRTEQTAAASICDTVRSRHLINAVGRTSLGEMAALIEAADLFIGNDSGPLHVAVALKKPCVAIFLSTSPETLLPARSDRIFVKRAATRPLYTHQPFFRYGRDETPARVACEEVLETVNAILTPQ
jgi:ADP-heptose:LPS heptosyltransferase